MRYGSRISVDTAFWRVFRRGAVSLALAAAGTASLWAAPPPDDVLTRHTRTSKFKIPFEYDESETRRLGAVAMQLYVSRDSGDNWELAASAKPSDGKFLFECPGDGDYLFSIRTEDDQGHLHPSGRHQPGLRVVVDATDPVIELSLARQGQEIVAAWQCVDESLDLNTLRLEVAGASGDWRDVEINRRPTGEVTLEKAPRGLRVRATVADLAGNSAVVENSLEGSDTSSGQAEPVSPRQEPDFRKPVAESPGRLPRIIAGQGSGRGKPRPVNTEVASTENGSPPASTELAVTDGLLKVQSKDRAGDVTRLPQGAKPPKGARLVNSRTFNIGYALDEVGPSGVSEVALYISENGGAKWFHYGTDPDLRSPFSVTVAHDGEFGFEIRARSGVGLAATPPQPGESPSIIVVVDQSPPLARLEKAEQGVGDRLDRITITWTADDLSLPDRPVALFYANQPTGPWEPITGWHENTGEYDWRIDPTLQRKVWLRMDVRDSAGNVTRVDAPEPLVLDIARPRARIVEIETVQPRQR